MKAGRREPRKTGGHSAEGQRNDFRERKKNERNKPKKAVKKEKPSVTWPGEAGKGMDSAERGKPREACPVRGIRKGEPVETGGKSKQESLILAQDERWRRA